MRVKSMMKKVVVLGLAGMLGAVYCSSVSFAEVSKQTVSGQSTASASKSTLQKVKDKVAISYYGIYSGPSIGGDSPSFTRDYDGNVKTIGTTKVLQGLTNQLYFSYRATPTIMPGVCIQSTYTPVRGQDLTMADPFLKVTDAALIHSGGFNLYGEYRYYLPTSEASKKLKLNGRTGPMAIVSYNVPSTRLSVGAWASAYWWLYEAKVRQVEFRGKPITSDGQAYFRPEAFYTITPKVSASLAYEMYGNHYMGRGLDDWYNAGTDLRLGSMINVFTGVNVNPYLQFATGRKVNMDTTAVGAQLFATIL